MGKAEECAGKDDGKSRRKGAERGLEAEKMSGLKGVGCQGPTKSVVGIFSRSVRDGEILSCRIQI